MKRIKPITQRLPRPASTSTSEKGTNCEGLGESCCQTASGCYWNGEQCVRKFS